VNVLWWKSEDQNSVKQKLVKARWKGSPELFSLYVGFSFYEKKDVTLSIYRHIIAVRITTFYIFSWSCNWSWIFFYFRTLCRTIKRCRDNVSLNSLLVLSTVYNLWKKFEDIWRRFTAKPSELHNNRAANFGDFKYVYRGIRQLAFLSLAVLHIFTSVNS
jgi:hypothetical protein